MLVFRGAAKRGIGMFEQLAYARQFGAVDEAVSMPPKYVAEGQHMSKDHEVTKSIVGGTPAELSGLLMRRAKQLSQREPPYTARTLIFAVTVAPFHTSTVDISCLDLAVSGRSLKSLRSLQMPSRSGRDGTPT